jgi:hypothetical protein
VSRVDRAIRRARQHLDRDEALLASAWGLEADGRRARVVVVTDRRVLVAWRRPSPPDELGMATTATYDRGDGVLALVDGDTTIRLRDVEPRDGRQVVQLLDRRHERPLADRIGAPFHVRVVRA